MAKLISLVLAAALVATGCATTQKAQISLNDAIRKNATAEQISGMIEDGADVNMVDAKQMTPLMLASIRGQMDVAKLLLDKGASVNAKDKNGMTPLAAAALSSHEDVARLLLDRGADPSPTVKTLPLLSIMVAKRKIDMAILLVSRGANVDARDRSGLTPLIYSASVPNNLSAIKLLLDKGADIDARGSKGITALMAATNGGDEAAVKLLLQRGADRNIKTAHGMTALDFAVKKNNKKIIALLKPEE